VTFWRVATRHCETPFFAFFRSRQYETIACEKKSQIGAVLSVLEGCFGFAISEVMEGCNGTPTTGNEYTLAVKGRGENRNGVARG
jgi:hypothetical protein